MSKSKLKRAKSEEMLLSCAGAQTAVGRVQVRGETESAATPMGQLAYFIKFLIIRHLHCTINKSRPVAAPMKTIVSLPRVRAAILVLGTILFPEFLPTATAAAEPGSTGAPQQRIEDLEQRNAVQRKALLSLAARLQRLEARTDQGQVAQAPVVRQAAAAPAEERDATPDKPATESENVVKKPAPSRSVQTVVEAEHAVFDRRLTLEAGLSYSRSDRKQLILGGFLALDAIFLGSISVDEVAADILTLDIGARYGLTPRLQLTASAPFLYRNTTYTKTAVGSDPETAVTDVTLAGELGDVVLGFNYQLLPESPEWPDIVLNVQAKAPTGSDPYGITILSREMRRVSDNSLITTIRTPQKLASGNGVWSLSTGLSLLRTVDPVVLFGSLNYIHNFTRRFDDVDGLSAGNQPGDVDLGDAIQYGLGMAIALNERTSTSLSFSHRLSGAASVNSQKLIGSDGNAATLNIGATYALSDRLSMLFNVGAGLTPDAPDLSLSLRFPYSFR